MPQLDTMVAVPGGQLRVVADGEGPPILLVHSAIVDLRGWDPIVPALVDAGYRAIRYDTRGFGSSSTQDVAFSNRADLIAVIDAVGARQVALVGNSRGAIIALDTVLEFPDRFVALIWVGGGVGGFDGGMTSEEEALEAAYEAADQAGDGDRMADLDLQLWVDGPGQPPTRIPAALREAVRAMDRPQVEPGRAFGKPIPLAPPRQRAARRDQRAGSGGRRRARYQRNTPIRRAIGRGDRGRATRGHPGRRAPGGHGSARRAGRAHHRDPRAAAALGMRRP